MLLKVRPTRRFRGRIEGHESPAMSHQNSVEPVLFGGELSTISKACRPGLDPGPDFFFGNTKRE